MLLLILPTVSLAGISVRAEPSPPQSQTETDLEEGRRLLSEGRFTEAAAAFNRHKQTNPADARAYFHAGMALAEAGRLSDAALELSEAVRLDPRQPQYLIFQANVFSRLKQNEHALETMGRLGKEPALLQLEPAWLWLASDTYYRTEQFNEALKILDLLSRRLPNDAWVDLTRGQVQVLMLNFDLALESFKKCLEKSPHNAPAHFEIGKIYYQRSELKEAQKSLREAIGIDPNQPEYLLKLGQVSLALGETKEAIVFLTRVEGSDPSLSQTYYALGTAYQRHGERAKAEEYRRKFQEISSKQREKKEQEEELSRLIAQGERQLDQGDENAARDRFEQAVKLNPKSWDAHAYLVEMSLATPDWRGAYQHLVKMEELDPDSAVGNYLMARYWYLSKEYEKALSYAEKVKLVRPGHAKLRNLIGEIYAALGQAEKATLEFEVAIRLDPERADFRENLQKVKKGNRQD